MLKWLFWNLETLGALAPDWLRRAWFWHQLNRRLK
jgi:hypothetical protein